MPICKECSKRAYYRNRIDELYYCSVHKKDDTVDIRHCEHNKERSKCKECGGASICEHNKERSKCKECGGASICEHNKERSKCKECGGTSICEHKKQRSTCIICKPERACQNCKYVYVKPRYRFHPYCFNCYCFINPDAEIPRMFKVREMYLRDALKSRLENVTMVFDKRVDGGCSRRRPDVLIDDGGFPIIIECDENKHSSYDNSCENKRVMELFLDLGNRPVRLVRFNPDTYIDSNNVKHSSCFKPTKSGLSVIKKEWEQRINFLVEKIEIMMKTEPKKEVEIFYMFY